jgi:hypothetical protein
MNHQLQNLIDNNVIGFSDVFEAYAQLCINTVRDITQDMILDEGAPVLIQHGTDISPSGLTGQAVDWALVVVPEMMHDDVDSSYEKKETESYLEFVIRVAVESRVKETKAFQIKFS